MRAQELPTDQIVLHRTGSRWAIYALGIGLLGGVASALVTLSDGHGGADFFRSYLVAFMFFLSLGLGALFFVLVNHLARAGWSVALRRLAEVISLTLVPMALLAVVVLLGRHELYEWTHAEAVAADELLTHKQAFLNTPFFVGRVAFYFLVWIVLAIFFARQSRVQDDVGDPETTLLLERVAAPAMIVFAMTLTFASFDFVMSLYPHWYSTIFGVYYFAGSTLGVFCLITLLSQLLQRAGKLTNVVTQEHYHDLGKFMFAFVVFWAYIGFSQYMLIWYAAIPEETEWFLARQEGTWGYLSLFLLFGHFVLPFVWLISRDTKRRTAVLAGAAIWLLGMHWFDLFWLVMPEARPQAPFRLLDLTCVLAVGGVFFAMVFWRLGRGRLIPLRDPRVEESLGFENA